MRLGADATLYLGSYRAAVAIPRVVVVAAAAAAAVSPHLTSPHLVATFSSRLHT